MLRQDSESALFPSNESLPKPFCLHCSSPRHKPVENSLVVATIIIDTSTGNSCTDRVDVVDVGVVLAGPHPTATTLKWESSTNSPLDLAPTTSMLT